MIANAAAVARATEGSGWLLRVAVRAKDQIDPPRHTRVTRAVAVSRGVAEPSSMAGLASGFGEINAQGGTGAVVLERKVVEAPGLRGLLSGFRAAAMRSADPRLPDGVARSDQPVPGFRKSNINKFLGYCADDAVSGAEKDFDPKPLARFGTGIRVSGHEVLTNAMEDTLAVDPEAAGEMALDVAGTPRQRVSVLCLRRKARVIRMSADRAWASFRPDCDATAGIRRRRRGANCPGIRWDVTARRAELQPARLRAGAIAAYRGDCLVHACDLRVGG